MERKRIGEEGRKITDEGDEWMKRREEGGEGGTKAGREGGRGVETRTRMRRRTSSPV